MRKKYTAVAAGAILGLLFSASCPASDLSDYLDLAKNLFVTYVSGEDSAAAGASSAAASGTDASAASAAAAASAAGAAASASSAASAVSGDDSVPDDQWYFFEESDGSDSIQESSVTETVIPEAVPGTEAAADSAVMSEACAQAYLEVLEGYRERVLLYDWQNSWGRYDFEERTGRRAD